MNELRKDRRAPASLKVKYKSATVDDFIEQFGADVSRGGIFIKTKKPLDTGALLKFEFQLQGGSAVIHGVGRVAWRRAEERARPDLPAGMGIKFIKLDDQSRAVIERIEARHGVGSRFDQTEAAEFATPLSSLPPNPARSGIATPPAPPPGPGAALGEPSTEHPTFRPPPPAISSIPPALADVWPAGASGRPHERPGAAANPPPAPAAPKGALGSFPNSARKSVPSVRSTTRDASEFLASAFSVGGAGHDVRSQARVQVERARRDPQSVELANELFGDLSEPSQGTKPQPTAAQELPELDALDAFEEIKPATVSRPAERTLAEKIPSIEELADEVPPESFQRSSVVSTPAVASSSHETKAVPLSLALSTPPAARLDSTLETLRPTAAPGRSSSAWLIGAFLFVAIAVGVFLLVRAPHRAATPAGQRMAQGTPAAATNQAEAAPPAALPSEPAPGDKPAAAAEPAKSVPIELNVTSEPRGAQVLVDDKPLGTTPTAVTLTSGVPAVISVRSAGYATKSSNIKPEPGMSAQHFALTPLPYELVMTTNPAGATIRTKDVSAVSPAPLVLGHLDGLITVSIEKDGYQRMSRPVRLEEFHEQNGTMRAEVSLSLSALPNLVRRKPALVREQPAAPPPEPPGVAPPVVLVKPEPSGEPEHVNKPAAEAAPAKPAAAPDALPSKPAPAPSPPSEPPAAAPATP
jgi:uncharacterized protein (TIGR02266 family)